MEMLLSALRTFAPWTSRLLLGFALGAGTILFMPDDWATAFYLAEFRGEHGIYVGAFFWTMVGLLAANTLFAVWPSFVKRGRLWKSERGFLQKWLKLSLEEQTVLAFNLERHTNTFRAPRYSRSVQNLMDQGLVVSRGRGSDKSWAYEIPWDIYEIMMKHRGTIRVCFDFILETEEKSQEVVQMIHQAEHRPYPF